MKPLLIASITGGSCCTISSSNPNNAIVGTEGWYDIDMDGLAFPVPNYRITQDERITLAALDRGTYDHSIGVTISQIYGEWLIIDERTFNFFSFHFSFLISHVSFITQAQKPRLSSFEDDI